MLHRRSPQDPNALYQFPIFKTSGKVFKKMGKGAIKLSGKAGKMTAKLGLKLPLIGKPVNP